MYKCLLKLGPLHKILGINQGGGRLPLPRKKIEIQVGAYVVGTHISRDTYKTKTKTYQFKFKF